MGVEEEDEKLKKLLWLLTWEWSCHLKDDLLQDEWECRQLRIPKIYKIRLRRRRRGTSLTKNPLKIEESNSTFNFNIKMFLQEPNTTLYSVDCWSSKRKREMKRHLKCCPTQVTPILENVTFLLLSHKSYTAIHTSLLCYFKSILKILQQRY